jgi:CRP-like cAMP-binding protein
MDNILETIRACSLLKDFSDEVLERFVATAKIQSFKAGDIIFVEMSEGPEIYLIASGEVSIKIAFANEEDHYEIIKLGRGEILGEFRFIDNIPRSGTSTAETDVETLVWDAASWREISETDFEVGYRLTLGVAKVLCERLRRWNVHIIDQVEWGVL